MRIGILKTDEVDPALIPRFGNLHDMMGTMLASSGIEQFEIVPIEVYQGCFPAEVDACDGYLITGSKSAVYDDDPWIADLLEFIRQLHARRVKTVGICFGHQAIAAAFGGRVENFKNGWGVGIHTYNVDDSLEVNGTPLDTVALPCSHQDQVIELPAIAKRVFHSDFCEYAGFTIGDHMLTMQPHPEFSVIYLECILRKIQEKFGERFPEAMASLENATDNEKIATLIAQFFLAD